MTSPQTDTTRDAFLGGRVFVHQPKTGFRGGTDSVLLAAAIDRESKGHALEFGCGAGAALLTAAWRVQQMKFTGIDLDPAALDLARQGICENVVADRVTCLEGDVAELPETLANRFDLVFSNPPFFEANRIEAPGPGKQTAYLESIGLEAWLKAMLTCLRPKGTVLMIHRAAELARILSLLEPRTGEIAVLPVRSFPGADAKRVIVKARKGLRRGGLRLLHGIHLYDRKGGKQSAVMSEIAREGAGLDWSGN